jgi:hypothetical protein
MTRLAMFLVLLAVFRMAVAGCLRLLDASGIQKA